MNRSHHAPPLSGVLLHGEQNLHSHVFVEGSRYSGYADVDDLESPLKLVEHRLETVKKKLDRMDDVDLSSDEKEELGKEIQEDTDQLRAFLDGTDEHIESVRIP